MKLEVGGFYTICLEALFWALDKEQGTGSTEGYVTLATGDYIESKDGFHFDLYLKNPYCLAIMDGELCQCVTRIPGGYNFLNAEVDRSVPFMMSDAEVDVAFATFSA